MTKPDDSNDPQPARGREEPPLFQHPQWTVGVVLIFALVAIVAGLQNPVWWIIGFPCILVLAVYTWVRFRG